MGAGDDLAGGVSTFMAELFRTSLILQRATPRSLVILDELGRGTSTFDGVAIAQATLKYLVRRVRSACLFVTHYPEISRLVTDGGLGTNGQAVNVHMGYLINTPMNETDAAGEGESDNDESNMDKDKDKERNRDREGILFLYKAMPTAALGSFGINAGRMAGLDERLLEKAEEMSHRMRDGLLR
jgi:DNA mismatch repair protein MSH3